jgi:predicted Zn-dependent protease
VKRRAFLSAACCCGASLAAHAAHAQGWTAPARFARPDVATDEGGLWAIMDREETRLRRSPFVLRDAKLQAYVQDIACRLAGDHCPDVRVHIVRTPVFNANMAANGMMQIWTGLLLRLDNEAQLAAVIGHEIGHYVERHIVDRLRDIKDRTAFAQFLGIFGLVGAIGQIAVLASAFAYSRDQERAADAISTALMAKAGYDPAEAAKVWGNLLLELKARDEAEASRESPLFATHPGAEERQQTLVELARSHPGGVTHAERWRSMVRPYWREWLAEEVKRGRHDQSVALLTRMLAQTPAEAEFAFARGEVFRQRGRTEDLDAALTDYTTAVSTGSEPPETHRGMGLIYQARQQTPEARTSFERYLQLAPSAPDALLIKSYMGGQS